MTERMTAADYRSMRQTRPVATPKAPKQTQTPEAPEPSPQSLKRTDTKREEDQRPPKLRPACAIAEYPGFEGLRFVAHGLTPEQARALQTAALAHGIPQQ